MENKYILIFLNFKNIITNDYFLNFDVNNVIYRIKYNYNVVLKKKILSFLIMQILFYFKQFTINSVIFDIV